MIADKNMLWQIIVIVSLSWAFLWRIQRQKFFWLAKELRNDVTSWPIVGHAYLFLGNDEDRMNAFKKLGREALKHGGITSAWLAHRIFAVIADPEAAECILKQCLDKDDVVKLSKYVTGNGSIFAPVPIWRPRRKVLAPTFSHRNLCHFVHVFARQSDVMAMELKEKAGAGSFPLWTYLAAYTMDSVCETTLGIKLNAQRNPEQPFLKAFGEYCHLVSARMCQPWLHSDFVYHLLPDFKRLTGVRDCMTGFVNEIVKSKREEREVNRTNLNLDDSKPEGFKTFLELLIDSSESDRGFTDTELREETLVIVMAGTDTTAVGTAFAAVMLSWYQDVQDKVYEELREVFGDSTRPVTPEDLPRLKYLDAVVRETLRLFPPVPLTARKIQTDLTLPSGITLPAGCGVVINLWALHRNTKYWGEDAEAFRPERFLNMEEKHPAQYMAFSYGGRNCIGYQYAMMSSKTALATLLRHYRLLPAHHIPGHMRPEPDHLRLKFGIMMKDVDNFMVRLASRQ